MPIVKLNQHFIDTQLQCTPNRKAIEFCSSEIRGFLVTVSNVSPGTGTYVLRYKNSSSQTKYVKIARTTDISLADARKKAKKLKAEIALGADPRRDEKARKEMPTLSVFLEEEYFPFSRLRIKTTFKKEAMYRLHIKQSLGRLKLNQIHRHHIIDLHSQLKKGGLSASSCNHYLRFLSHTFNYAIDRGLLDRSPTTGVKHFHEDNKVENYLTGEQLERLLTVLNTDHNRTVCLICLYLLSTGARLSEALNAEWKYINRAERLWTIPSKNSKSKRIRSIPLNDSAERVLDELSTESSYEYLFINSRTNKPFTTIHKTWSRLRNLANLPFLRLHDLRHNYASFLVNSGRTLFEVQSILGHSDPKVTQRYSHLTMRTLQEAANSASEIINASMKERG